MKKVLLFIAIAFVGMNANAQVPSNLLAFRQDFTGNYNVTSALNATSSSNTATLTNDEFTANANNVAGNFDLGQTIEYPFSSNSHLMVGSTNAELTISVKVYIDPVWLAGLANGQYITFLMHGNSYMRLYKNGGYLLQCGVFNNNPESGSFGYLGAQGGFDPQGGWNTITMVYGPEYAPNIGSSIRIFVNGVYTGFRKAATAMGQNVSYNSATEKLVLGRAVSSNQNFKGKIDRVLIYDRRLSAAEVLGLQREQALTEYSFNNTYNSIAGGESFFNSTGLTFVNDRNGNPNSALNFTNINGTQASILNLPYANCPRTISVWVKQNTFVNGAYNYPFIYGNTNYLLSHYQSSDITISDNVNFMSVAATNTAATWMHLVYVYDGANTKIYKNGVSLGSTPINLTTQNNNNIFKLGYGPTNIAQLDAALDDLKIYKYPLSDTEVLNLYNYNSLSTQNFQTNSLKAAIYPNPASNNFTIEMENEVKSVEIYSFLGQKVLSSTSKTVNVSSLSKGVYMVRIEDEKGGVATQKIVKE